jgi:hypothetical protein
VKPGTRIVPANGRLSTGAELAHHHEMYAAFHERMIVYLNKGWDFGDPSAFVHGAFMSLDLAYSPD